MNRQLMLKINFVITLLLFQQTGVAKDYKITQLSSNEGLSQQDVECIVQDKQGFIWIGTYDGLNRYDGNNILVYRHIPNDSTTISDNRILCMEEWAERGELWIGTDGGLNCFDKKSRKFRCYFDTYKNKNSFPDNQINCLDLEKNNLWIGTTGVNKITFNAENIEKIEYYPLEYADNTTLQRINDITHDINGNILVGSNAGLFVKTHNSNKFEPVKEITGYIRRFIKDKSGNFWILSSNGILYFTLDLQKRYNYLSNPEWINFKETDVKDLKYILPISNQHFLSATSNQLYWISKIGNNYVLTNTTFTDKNFFRNNDIKALMLDRSNNVWITSGMDGIAKFDIAGKSINYLALNNSIENDKIHIQTIIKDYKERIWIGSNKGVYIKDSKSAKSLNLKNIGMGVFDLLEDKTHGVWITSLNAISYLPNGDANKIVTITKLPNFPKEAINIDGPNSSCVDSRNIVWIGLKKGLIQIRRIAQKNNSFDIKLFKISQTNNNITKLVYDNKNNILLIGTKKLGLLKATLNKNGDIESISSISKLKPGKPEHVWSIFKAYDDTFYIGTDSGIRKLISTNGNQSLEIISSDYRLQTYKIAGITGDDNKNLWLSTSMGLLCYNLNDSTVKQYYNTDGLSTNTLTEGSLYNGNGFLYIGSIKGVNIIDLSTLKANKAEPQTELISLKINNLLTNPLEEINGRVLLDKSLETTDKIKLKYFENNFTFEFASLHFSNPAKNKYSYRLVGFSNDWTEVNNSIRSATFTNVPPGKYTLEVKSSNCDGVWNETPKTMIIQINPAPWNTFWAYLIYFIIAVSIIYFILKYYFDRQKLKKELLEEHFQHSKDLEIAEVKLKYHTNITHELRTPLSLISAPTEELIAKSYNDDFLNSRLQIIKSNADRLLQLIGQFLDFRKVINEKYTLSIANNNLNELLLNIKDNFSPSAKLKHISLELFYDLSEKNYWFDKEMVNKICYNLLSNAIKHTPTKGKISIYASQSSDETRALISVEDNGVGIAENEIGKIFERFYQVPGSVGGTGIGLNLCKHLANLHLGDITVKSRVGGGTIFTLEIPIAKEAYNADVISEKHVDTEIEKPEFIQEIDEEIDTKPVILVIEDNFELRDYIFNFLSDHYNVLVAENGAEGLKMAIEHIPDIIISDIMMPVMDGIEFTENCKNNVNTSHIPVILLTAKASEESQIEGLSYGADDYITKPFNPQILKLKVNNLIKLTKKRKKEVSQNIDKLNEREQKFISTFEQIVLDNYSTPDFGIDKICNMMFMSRMQLYRKMMAIVNKKPLQLIKEIKMKKALELMKEKGMNITETMYELEYTNYTHFTKQFTEVNGISPRKVLGMKE
ncbi:MAG: ATP-binding protein [Paludibacter sp.]